MTSSSHFWYRSRSKFAFPYLCPIELKFGTGVNSEALISNSRQQIRYKHVLKEKNEIFYEKLKIFPKRSLTKVLPWQDPWLMLTEYYFK